MDESLLYLEAQAALHEVKDENPDIPAEFWESFFATLGDSRLYYGVEDVRYEIALEILKTGVTRYRQENPPPTV